MTISMPPIPVDSVPVIDPQTGRMTKPWRDYLIALHAALKAATA